VTPATVRIAAARLKKSLGQHFLHDARIARRIVDAAGLRPGDAVLEIGPGGGALTRHIIDAAGRVTVVELDRRVLDGLRGAFGDRVGILHGDILKTDLSALADRMGVDRWRVIGNLPYYITTPILFHLLEHRARVQDAVIMMQREVAARLVARPGTKDYGILTVECGLLADLEVLFSVQPGAFVPPPGVVSSMVRVRMLPAPRFSVPDEAEFRRLVRATFGKRRKTLRNTLKLYLDAEPPERPAGIDLSRRPEDLTLEEFVGLSNALHRGRGDAP
jgi:16S rRNA (adenine1518-N6/adenine1519-N6)-dimethyltransferase